MFEAVVTLSPARKPSPRQIELLCGALALHAVVAAAILAAQLWPIENVPAPDLVPAFLAPVEVLFTPTPEPVRARAVAPRRSEAAAVAKPALPSTPAPAVSPEQLASAAVPTAPGDGRITEVGGLGTGDPAGAVAAGDSGGSDVAIAFGAGMVAPEIVFRVDPLFPELARRMRREGIVVVRAEIGRDGDVHAAQVAMAEPPGLGFEQSALDAVRAWKFRPATLAGRPVAVLYHLTVRFRLR